MGFQNDKLDSSSLQMLHRLYDLEEGEALLSKDFQEITHLTRAPIQLRLRQMLDAGLVQREIKPGTEAKRMPTYLYRLDPNVPKNILEQVLNIEESKKQGQASKDSNNSQEAQKEAVLVASTAESKENFYQTMAELLSTVCERIDELKVLLCELEKVVPPGISVNRAELLQKLIASDSQ
jgi:predicted transcriptional regulator